MPIFFTVSNELIEDDNGNFIPVDPLNADYQDYLAWVAAGNTAENFTPPPSTDEVEVYGDLRVGQSQIFNSASNNVETRILTSTDGVLSEIATAGSGGAVVLEEGAILTDAISFDPVIYDGILRGKLYTSVFDGDTFTQFEGNANDVLISTGTSVEWNASSGVGDIVRSTNPTITDLQLSGYLDISGVGVGTSGQLLSSTGTGIEWASTTGSGNVVRATSPTITTPTIAKLANLTTNGFVKTSGSDGTLSVDTATYLQAMAYSNASVTTADLTGSLNTIHYLDVSGMTANRTFTMPTATAAGQRCTVFLSTGSASYALIIALATNEYTRMFNSLECVSFISVGAGSSAWILDVDKRIPCTARLTYTGVSGQSITSGSITQVTLNSSSFETAGINDTTNSRLKIRRSGKYHVTGNFRFASITATIPRMVVSIRLTSGSVILQTSEIYALSTTTAPAIVAAGILDLTAGGTIELTVFQNSGSAQSTASSANYPTLAMSEILL